MDSNFKKAFDILMGLEFSNPSNALHQNKGENGLTFMGIYQVAHPNWAGWGIIKEGIELHNGNIKEASKELYSSTRIQYLVEDFYKEKFWDRAKLDSVESGKKCEEVFIFGVNAGMRTSIRKTQKLVGAVADGIVGSQTIEAINKFPEGKFDMMFDEIEIQYYADIIKKKPSFKIFENGWENRARAV
jgi:lysozyme family protein